MPLRLTVRRCRTADLDDVLEIERTSFGADAWPRALFIELLEESPQLFLLAVAGGHIGGYIAAVVRNGTGELVSIAVHPDYRCRGMAGALLRRVLSLLRSQGVEQCWLMVRPGNRVAIQFHKSAGFRLIRRVKDYYGARRDGLRMRLTL